MRLKVLNKNINLWLLLLLLCMCGDVLPKNPYKSGEVRVDYPKGCAYLSCKRGDQCVNRKFWCRNPPCPSMLYCSKSRKESLKGPSSCEAVRCSKGFVCLVRVRHCRWGEACEQQIARCVSERDYYEGPASCVDFTCPSGLRCILRESLCAKPPCKLVKSCANTKDVKTWYEGCKSLGCLSEHECFLRRPTRDCRVYPCKHTPDCSAKTEEDLEAIEQCRGWVCPTGEECSAHTQGPCKRESCRISRSCHRPLMVPLNVTPPSKHSWRDDAKLSFYSKLDKNLSAPQMNRPSSGRSKNNKIPRRGIAGGQKISNPRPVSASSATPDIVAGPVVQPTVTSLSTWLNHLKLKTGVDAIEAWIKKSEKQENYGAFLEWLESVKDMLGPAAYDLWIEEVRTMTVTSPAFQKWLPPIPTSSPSVSPDFNEPFRNIADANRQGLQISPGSQKSVKYRHNEDKNYSQRERINAGVREIDATKVDDFKEESYIFPPKNDTTPIRSEMTETNPIPTPSGILVSPSPVRISDWQQFYTPDPRIVQQAYPFQQNVGNVVPWGNQAPPFPAFDTLDPTNPWFRQFQQSPGINPHFSNPNMWQGQSSPLMNSQRNYMPMDRRFLDSGKIPDQQFQTNWSFQQSLNTDPNFHRPNIWQQQLFSPPNPELQQETDPRDQFNRRILESKQFLGGIPRQLIEEPLKVYSDNSTNADTSWIKYFLDQTSQQYVPPENFGTFPIAGENLGYESWPGSNYRERSLADVPHRRTKHEDSTRDFDHFSYGDRDAGRSGQTSRDFVEDPRFIPGFSWHMDPRLQNRYLHFRNQDRENLYDKSNREGPPVFSSLPRIHRVDANARSPSPITFFEDSQRNEPRLKYHWPNIYLHDRLYRIVGPRSPPSTIALQRPAIRIREYNERLDPFPKPNQPEVNGNQKLALVFHDREFDAPGQSMGVPDLWNPKYRTPLSSVLQNFDRERFGYRDLVKQKYRMSTTIAPPVVPSSGSAASQQLVPIANEHSHSVEDDDYQQSIKNVEDYDEDDDVYPLVLSLQGYIETSKEEESENPAIPSKNSTILPVYMVEDAIDVEDDYSNDYENPSDGNENLFKNQNYGGTPDFPNNLKSVFDVEAAMIMKNTTGQSDVEIKDIKWEYEDDEDDIFVEDPSSFLVQSQNSFTSTHGLSNMEEARDWTGSTIESRNEGNTENDYYDEGLDYEDEAIPGDRSNYNFVNVNSGDSFHREEVPEDLIDSFYNDPDHKRFKKNRP